MGMVTVSAASQPPASIVMQAPTSNTTMAAHPQHSPSRTRHGGRTGRGELTIGVALGRLRSRPEPSRTASTATAPPAMAAHPTQEALQHKGLGTEPTNSAADTGSREDPMVDDAVNQETETSHVSRPQLDSEQVKKPPPTTPWAAQPHSTTVDPSCHYGSIATDVDPANRLQAEATHPWIIVMDGLPFIALD